EEHGHRPCDGGSPVRPMHERLGRMSADDEISDDAAADTRGGSHDDDPEEVQFLSDTDESAGDCKCEDAEYPQGFEDGFTGHLHVRIVLRAHGLNRGREVSRSPAESGFTVLTVSEPRSLRRGRTIPGRGSAGGALIAEHAGRIDVGALHPCG